MKVNDKVKGMVDGKYLPGIVNRVVDAKGFGGAYPYQKVWVEFEDGKIIQYRSFDLIEVYKK